MTHGFITIATGDTQYYQMAVNLLHSYRYFSKAPLPFAILTDQENEYTAEFDTVRLFSHAHRNYLDKLEMFALLPYDVNLFIDADCLAYGDLNRLFTLFQNADDFSCFGRVLPLDDTTGWFEYKNLGELQEKVSYVVGLHGGIYYMRKTERCRAVLETAQKLVPHYREYRFKGKFATPGDEPLVALSMALNGCKPIPHDLQGILCYWKNAAEFAQGNCACAGCGHKNGPAALGNPVYQNAAIPETGGRSSHHGAGRFRYGTLGACGTVWRCRDARSCAPLCKAGME